jgi:hypothetical protein
VSRLMAGVDSGDGESPDESEEDMKLEVEGLMYETENFERSMLGDLVVLIWRRCWLR